MKEKILIAIKTLGPLRLGLLTMVAVDMILRPVPGEAADLHGFGVFTDLIVPVLSPILFMLLLLDSIMTGVYMSGMEGDKKKRYRNVLFLNLTLAIVFVLYWKPYFMGLNF